MRRLSPPRHSLPLLFSAGWLLTAHTALHAQGWDCSKAADGSWQCRAGAGALPAAETPAQSFPTDTVPPDSPAPASAALPAAGEKPAPTQGAERREPPAAAPAQSAEASSDEGHSARSEIREPVEDWVPQDRLTAAQLEQKRRHCCGTYVEPARDDAEAGTPPEQAPVRAKARNTAMTGKSTVEFSGNVSVTQGWRQIKAGKATLDREKSTLELSEGVEIREPGMALVGERAVVRDKVHKAEIHDARFVFHRDGIRGTAQEIERRGNATLADRATMTTCGPEDNAWLLKSRKLRLEHEEGFGTAKGAVLEVVDVPVAYVPYMKFPIDKRRHTGVLWPTIGSTSDGGLDVTVPVYLNLAPNYDATVSPRYIADRGEMLENQVRYLNEYSDWTLAGHYLNNDEKTGQDRWLLGVNEFGSLGDGWSTKIDYTRVSDYDYMKDLGNSGLNSQRNTHLRQLGQVGWSGEDWRFTALAQQYQTLDPDITKPYQILPQLQLENWGDTPFELNPLLVSQVSAFHSPDGRRIDGDRVYLEPGISYPMEWLWGHLIPKAKLRHVSYQLSDPAIADATASDNPSATAPSYSLDAGLQFERQMHLGTSPYVQTLEPRLFYLYSDYENQDDLPDFDTNLRTFSFSQLYRDTRFSGYDRLADANQVTVGATSRFLSGKTGQERLSASLGQIFYLEDRRVTNIRSAQPYNPKASTSELAGELSYRLNSDVRARGSVLWDPDSNLFNEGGMQLNYHNEDDLVLNAGYRFRRERSSLSASDVAEICSDPNQADFAYCGSTPDVLLDQYRDLSQTDFSGIVPIADDWAAVFRWNYDLNTQRPLEELAGIEYTSCCWRTRLVYQRAREPGTTGNDYEHGIFLQFQLIGLGGVGGQVDDILDDSIIGYREREDNAL